jgi:phytoene dehydrogenase-like protein
MYDTVIIGAGMSGLAAGIRLAHFGRPVCILERHTTIGGLNSFYRLEGRNYDVGLHAVTNLASHNARRGPLRRVLRQLRIPWDAFDVAPQIGSAIAFPDVTLRFSNDIEELRSAVAAAFPGERANFDRLLGELADYDELESTAPQRSARGVVGSILGDPLLIDMLFCPLMYYGSAAEHDMDFAQFSIMFRSIFLEGLGRPWAGVRQIVKHLVRTFKASGGELQLRSGVRRLHVERGKVARIDLDDGRQIAARRVLSSAGWVETMRLCDAEGPAQKRLPGTLSFCETITTLDVAPSALGYDETLVFFNDGPTFHWEKPDTPCDLRSGVICSPNNFHYDRPLDEGMMRVTALANFDYWNGLQEEGYRREKSRWFDQIIASAVRFVPDFRPHIVATDMFTPTTVVRFTGHENGAVYGAPEKQRDGTTYLDNLFICGTDQGYVGIVGSMMSGIAMANRHLLR